MHNNNYFFSKYTISCSLQKIKGQVDFAKGKNVHQVISGQLIDGL